MFCGQDLKNRSAEGKLCEHRRTMCLNCGPDFVGANSLQLEEQTRGAHSAKGVRSKELRAALERKLNYERAAAFVVEFS